MKHYKINNKTIFWIAAGILIVLLLLSFTRNMFSESCENDSDCDGIINEADSCPNTNPEDFINSEGCSPSQSDTDTDGVKDSEDQCPQTPAGTKVDLAGC